MTQVDLEFIDLTTNKTIDKPRLAAEFVMIAGELSTNNFTINKRKTVDDEYTPGTFTLVDIMANNGTLGNYYVNFPQMELNDCNIFYEIDLSFQEVICNSVQSVTQIKNAISHPKPRFMWISRNPLQMQKHI